MHDTQHKRKGIASRVASRCKSLFHKICEFLSWLWTPSAANASPEVILRIRQHTLDEHDQQVLSDYIALLSHLRQTIQVESLTEEIPNEYIGTQEWWDGAKLECRGYLKLQVEFAVKKYIAFQPIPEQAAPASQDDVDNHS